MANNPWFAILSFLVAVLGVPLAIALYLKARRVKLPSYAIRSTNIFMDLAGRVKGLQVSYQGQEVENLTSTKIVFWNAGKETIRKNDVPSQNPLRIEMMKDDLKIMDARVLHVKEPANNITLSSRVHPSSLGIGFDYLDKDEGVVIQLLHTGESSKDIAIKGRVMGAGEPVSRPNRFSSDPDFKALGGSWRVYAAYRLVIPLIMIIVSLAMLVVPFVENAPAAATGGLMAFGLVLLVVMVNHLMRRVPPGFEVFEEEF